MRLGLGPVWSVDLGVGTVDGVGLGPESGVGVWVRRLAYSHLFLQKCAECLMVKFSRIPQGHGETRWPPCTYVLTGVICTFKVILFIRVYGVQKLRRTSCASSGE